MTDLTREQIVALMDGTTPGPWQADGEPWNRIVWSSAENRVCFMAHSNGLDDDRDLATSRLVAAAPDLARQLLATMTERDEARAAQAGVVERCATEMDLAAHIMSRHGSFQEQRAYENAAKSIRSLADPTGVKLLAELRAEIEALKTDLASYMDAANEYARGEDDLRAQLAEAQKREAGLREALTEAVEIVHKSYVAATMEAVNAGPSHPIKDKYDAWRVRCMNAETKARAALSAAPTGEESNG